MESSSSQVTPVVEVSLGWLEVTSLISGIASLILAIFAIWLSITFYKMSNESSKEIKESSNNINNNVNKLEKIFDTMYSDTFGMVKDTVDHMRKQADKSNGPDISAEVKKQTEEAVTLALSKMPSDNLSKNEAKSLVLDMVEQSKENEKQIKIKNIKNAILDILKNNGPETYIKIRDTVYHKYNITNENEFYFKAIDELSKEGAIEDPFSYHEKNRSISHTTLIKLKKGFY